MKPIDLGIHRTHDKPIARLGPRTRAADKEPRAPQRKPPVTIADLNRRNREFYAAS